MCAMGGGGRGTREMQIISAPCAMYVLNEIYTRCPRKPKWVPSQVQGVVEGFLEEGPPELSCQ